MTTETPTPIPDDITPEMANKLCSFLDRKGKRWILELTVGRVRKIKNALGVNLIDTKGEGLTRLYANPMDLADTLFLLVEDQAAAAGVSDEDFGERLAGDTMEHATVALTNAVVFFSPKPMRKPMLVAMQKVDQLRGKQAAACVAWLESADAEAEMEKHVVKTPGSLSDSLREFAK